MPKCLGEAFARSWRKLRHHSPLRRVSRTLTAGPPGCCRRRSAGDLPRGENRGATHAKLD
jgi:hypothetical protein